MKFYSEVRKDIVIDYDWVNSEIIVMYYGEENPNIIRKTIKYKKIEEEPKEDKPWWEI